MFYFYLFFAILVLVSTNPIPDDTTMFNSDAHDDILTGSGFSSNEVTIADSNVVADSGCFSNTDKNLDDNIQKRFNFCPTTAEPIPKLQPNPAKAPKKPTSTSDNPCNNEYPRWLFCGGPEVTDSRITPIFASVLNCVEGMNATSFPIFCLNLYRSK